MKASNHNRTLSIVSLGLLTSLALIACDPINGTLQVAQSFTALAGSSSQQNCGQENPNCGASWGKHQITITPGSYNMSVESGRNDLQIDLKGANLSEKLELTIPAGKQIPDSGRVTLTSQETGQPFDLEAVINTDVQDSAKTNGYETCQVSYQEQVCAPTGDGGPGNPPQIHCWFETHTRQGQQQVEYFVRSTNRSMTAEILLLGSTTSAAHFSGNRMSKQKIYTYQSPCF